MNDDRMNEVARGSSDIERDLGRLGPAPVPPGLHQRVMDRAREFRGKALLSTGMRRAAVACSILIVALLAADPFLSRQEVACLASIVDVRVQPGPSGETPADLAEVLVGTGEAEEAARMARREIIAAAAALREQESQFTAAWKRLKGGSAHEAFEDII